MIASNIVSAIILNGAWILYMDNSFLLNDSSGKEHCIK